MDTDISRICQQKIDENKKLVNELEDFRLRSKEVNDIKEELDELNEQAESYESEMSSIRERINAIDRNDATVNAELGKSEELGRLLEMKMKRIVELRRVAEGTRVEN